MSETPPLPTPLAAVEAMARAMSTAYGYDVWRQHAADVLTALSADGHALVNLALYPGVADVIAGSAVVVPKIQSRCVEAECPSFGEPCSRGCGCFRDVQAATRAAIAAIGGTP